MKLELIIEIAKYVSGAVVSGVPLVIALMNKIKAVKKAKTEAEKIAAVNEITDQMVTLIGNAEALFAGVNTILKQQGQSAGVLKKENVMAKLQAYALEKGYVFDAEYWSKAIDNQVGLTRKVNA